MTMTPPGHITQLPPGLYKYEGRTTFVKYPHGLDTWHIWGPENEIVEGAFVDVYVFSEGALRTVEVIKIVAERTVHRHDKTRVRYVMATFDNIEDRKELGAQES